MNVETVRLIDSQEVSMLAGAGLLGLVTTGMYDNPLSMYREYIQNAVDAVARSGIPGTPRVAIAVDVIERRIMIQDNGPGLSREDALERLLPIGRSNKRLGIDRGFRGVGRLAGLAFAKTVTFTTRACGDQPVTRITWHSDRLPELTATESVLEQAILDCVDVDTLSGSEYPEHFFEVEVGEVARHSAGVLLNREAVRDYIGEVCPVPMSAEFPFAEHVEELFERSERPFTLEVLLEGDPTPVERPYGGSISLSANRSAEFAEIQMVRIPNVEGSGEAAAGWIAHSPYLGAIPKGQRIRGIRARVGNVQIGGEGVFDDLFKEQRFNRWCVGEIHILDPRIIPNARRDYFQPGPHLRNLENQLTPVLREISARCRRESTTRNRDRRTLSSLGTIEDLYALATSGYLNAEDSARLVREALQEIDEVRKSIRKGNLGDCSIERLETAEENLHCFSGEAKLPQFQNMTAKEVDVYQKVFGALVTLAPSPSSAKDLIELVYAELAGTAQNGSGIEQTEEPERHFQAQLSLDDSASTILS